MNADERRLDPLTGADPQRSVWKFQMSRCGWPQGSMMLESIIAK